MTWNVWIVPYCLLSYSYFDGTTGPETESLHRLWSKAVAFQPLIPIERTSSRNVVAHLILGLTPEVDTPIPYRTEPRACPCTLLAVANLSFRGKKAEMIQGLNEVDHERESLNAMLHSLFTKHLSQPMICHNDYYLHKWSVLLLI